VKWGNATISRNAPLTWDFSLPLSVIDAYTAKGVNPGDLENAVGFFLAAWFIFTFVRIASYFSCLNIALI
jgi:succinate-acetate transporter protein